MNRFKAGWPKGKKKSSNKGAPSSLASYGPGAPPLQFQRSSQALPPLIEDCLAWLEAHRVWEVEGIFRISGDFHEIKALLRKYAKGKKVKLDDETTGLRAHTVACLFKTYLRELPIPLLTFELYKPFLSAIGVPDEKARLELIRTTMAMLPPANKALLTRLLALMRKVADYADTNKMHAQNLAIVFAPCLLRPENDDLMAALMDGGVSQALLSTMVTHYSYFFIEKGDKSETTKQLTGEYKDFYRTLRKGTLRLAASMVEEKKLLQRLEAGEDYQSEGEGGGGDVEGGLASMSSEVRRFAAKAEPRRRAITTTTTLEAAAAQGKPLPAPPRPSRPPPVTKLPAAPDAGAAQPLRPQPPIPQPAAEHIDDPAAPRDPQEPQQPKPDVDYHLKAAPEEPAVMDLKKTRKLPKQAGAKDDGGDKEERERERKREREKEKERERKAKQISMSWNPSHVRRELDASSSSAKGEQGRLLYADLEGSGKELLRSHSTQIASIRRRLKQSSAELASSSDSDSSGEEKDDDRTRARSLCRSTPAAKVASAASDSDSDHSTQRLSSSHRVRSVRSRLQSDSDSSESESDSDSDSDSASSSDEPTAKRNENKKSRDDNDASENSGDEVKVVTTKQTTTYLTPEQMMKLVRQQRAQQRKELLAKKKNDKQRQNKKKKQKRSGGGGGRKKEGSGSDSDSSSSEEDSPSPSSSSSASSSGSDSDDEGDVRSKRKSPPPKSLKAVSHRNPMGKSMPTRPSASPTPSRLAASMPSPHEERKEESTPSGGSSSSSEDDADDAEVVLAWSEKMAEGDLAYFERLVDGGSNSTASPDLAALAKDVDLVSLDHFQ